MHYEGTVYRPPSEAASILLQVTTGCSHNKCSFCGMYKEQKFRIKNDAEITEDILFASRNCKNQHRLFLCDGDALSLSQKRLVTILKLIRQHLPWLERIGAYANPQSIYHKSSTELEELQKLGLKIVYMGLETGDDITLQAINKGADSKKIIEMGRKVRKTGIKLSLTVILGIAGKDRSFVHAKETGRALSEIDPEYVGALSLMLVPGTKIFQDHEKGKFELLEPLEMLAEIGVMIRHTQLTDGYFHANHASNYLPIKAKFPQDKERTLRLIGEALEGNIELKPEILRGL